MPNALGLLLRQLKDIWSHFGVNQKVSVILALVVVGGITGGVLYWSAKPSFALLYSGMSLGDAAAAREKLADEKILVELRDSGRAIYVPAGDVYRGRLVLASAGLPKNTTAGFEMFEQPKFGLTEFAQKVNYQRALQGELERTIANVEGIQSARVMLVLPSDRLFASDAEKRASASVMLGLSGGSTLTSAQIRSIKQLVSSAVPGLSSSAVAITDQQGRLLSQRVETEENQLGSVNDQIEIQERVDLGAIPGSKHVARGMLEFWADPASQYYRDFFKPDRRIIVYCAGGGRSALAARVPLCNLTQATGEGEDT